MTPKPEHVSGEPIRFLGMEVSKRAEEGGKEVWYVTQKSYIKDMVEKSEEKVKERKIPVTRDQAHIEEPSSPPTIDQVRGAQKCIGRSFVASHQVTPRPHVRRGQDGVQRPQKPRQGHGAWRTDERIFE